MPKKTVINNLQNLWLKFLHNILWWVQVIETPEVNKIIVFNKGILNGSKIKIPVGGQWRPNSIEGESLEWKNDQKKEIKKKISETINSNMPNFSPNNTLFVWFPWKVLSRTISRHHWNFVNKIIKIPKTIKLLKLLWNNLIIPDKKINKPKAPVKGQGL